MTNNATRSEDLTETTEPTDSDCETESNDSDSETESSDNDAEMPRDETTSDGQDRHKKTQVATAVFTNSRHKKQPPRKTPEPQPSQRKTAAKDLVVIGKGAKTLSLPARSSNPTRPNRRCTGLFVTRLQKRIKSEQLERQVYLASGYNFKAEKLETKHDSYSSFFVRADRSLRDALMDPDIWPTDSMVRLFFEC
jgi:hypothetical protein